MSIYIGNEILRALLVTCGKDHTDSALNGIQVEHSTKYGVLLVSTDSHRLSIARVDYGGADFDSFIMPRSMVDGAKGKSYYDDNIICDGNMVTLSHNGTNVSSLKINATYPAWRNVLSPDFTDDNVVINPQHYGDLGKIRKLLGCDGGTTDLRTKEDGLCMDRISEDFVTYVMPMRRGRDYIKKSAPEWVKS